MSFFYRFFLSLPSLKWLLKRKRSESIEETPNLLPTLIKVLAAFIQVDGEILEEEIDSILGFLRHDYPETIYSQLRRLFRQALEEQQDLSHTAAKLATNLTQDQKILLGVQLYDLIFRSGMRVKQLQDYYRFMAGLGMEKEAIGIVYQLNDHEESLPQENHDHFAQLEVLRLGNRDNSDINISTLSSEEELFIYRYHELIILKNLSRLNLIIQGRLLKPKQFCRIYQNQRLFIGDEVFTTEDLIFYFNAKKNVSLPRLFITLEKNQQEIRIDKVRHRENHLEITFGTKTEVVALQDTPASLQDTPLKQGVTLKVANNSTIFFEKGGELQLQELRKKTPSLGTHFRLKASKSEYLVSNNPGLLEAGDILLSYRSGGELLLKISCNYHDRTGYVQVLKSDHPIFVHQLPLKGGAFLVDGDTITINAGQVLRCNFTDRIIEEERNIVHHLEVQDLLCRFPNGKKALDDLTFSVMQGEMVCVMGSSGSGKSTLLRALAGDLKPVKGEVLLNGQSLYKNEILLRQYITYIPQYEAFDGQLTIEENLLFAAALRAPHLSRKEQQRRIDHKLAELGLHERRNNVVGDPYKKVLSGGERKRLNIGLDMVSTADVYLFDEPTSGLSSKDSEHVIDIIRGIAHNKIVLVTIHQPSSKIFHMFQKALLLDKEGKLVFFGTPSEMLHYFAEAEHEQLFGHDLEGCPSCGATKPEFVFDVLETPLRDFSGGLIYQENSRGQLVPARRFSPDYWRDRFEGYRLIKEVQDSYSQQKSLPTTLPTQPIPENSLNIQHHRWKQEITQFWILWQRAFISKLRHRANLFTTLVEAPILALLLGGVLRYSESSTYDFASAFHIPTYLFLSLVVAMFLGLTNSVDDIIRDRPVLLRERNLNVRLGYYLFAKVMTLGLFAVLQCAFFTLIGDWILSIRGFFWGEFWGMFLTAMSGIAIGLLISSLAEEGKTAVNIIPVVLIPQIILGGALIKYEEMNRNLDFIYSVEQWFHHHPETAIEPQSDLHVPFICELIPMRWSYEALIYAQAKMNPLALRQARIERQIHRIISIKNPSQEELDRLEDLKELLAVLSGMEGATSQEIEKNFHIIDKVIDGAPYDPDTITHHGDTVTAEQLYTNQKVIDLVSKAEMEQADYRTKKHSNVFFGPVKYYLGCTINILWFNISVLIFSTGTIFLLLYSILKRQIKTRQR